MITAMLCWVASSWPVMPGDPLEPCTFRTATQEAYSWNPGQVTVLAVTSYWCDTWKPQVERLTSAHLATDTGQIAVCLDARWSEFSDHWNWGVKCLDVGRRWSDAHGIDRIPTTLVVDRSGLVRWAQTGVIRSADLVRAVHLAKSGPSSHTIHLTFDDFPNADSDLLLDVLRTQGVKASFFCVGGKLGAYEKVCRRALAEGHRLEVHSWNHDGSSPEVDRCVKALRALGAGPHFYRPPGSESVFDLKGAKLTLKSLDPYDYVRPASSEIARRILTSLRDSDSIVQLHDGVAQTRDALPKIVESARRLGYRLTSLDPERFADVSK
jgi:peptidoglycan/xylan/chitin deacetylase (PgdA/CDA1 family)